MLTSVGLSAWLNYGHGLLLRYPVPIRVLFGAPPVIAGWLFELQLRGLHLNRLHELSRTTRPLPQFGPYQSSGEGCGAIIFLSRLIAAVGNRREPGADFVGFGGAEGGVACEGFLPVVARLT